MADQFEYRLNLTYQTMRMPVPFTPEVVFIYNPSNATLYLNTTTYAIPTTTNYDLSIPAHAYTIFKPYTPNTEYGALLVVPGGGAIEWDCWIEFRKGEKEIQWDVIPDFPVIQPLSPLPDIDVFADWTYEVAEATGYIWDFTTSDRNFEARDPAPLTAVYAPGVGWQSQLQPTNVNDEVAIVSQAGEFSGNVTEIGVGYTDSHSSNTTFRQLCTVKVSPPPGSECVSDNTTTHGSLLYQGALSGAIVTTEVDLSLVNQDPTPPNTGQLITIEYAYVRGTFTIPPVNAEAIDIEVQFTDLSTGAVGAWFWDFGDGQTSTLQNPLHTYNFAGVYTVTLYAIGVYGTISSFTADVYVNAVADEVLDFV